MITIFFDGLCEPNPGGIAAFGFVIHGIPDATIPVCGCAVLDGDPKAHTNNYAEYVALGKALAYLVLAKVKVDELNILGDSQVVVNQLVGYWACASPNLIPLRDRCREHLKSLGIPDDKVKSQWIPRDQNVQSDALARAAYVGRVGKLPPERGAKK